jgi:hypothetical protein
MYGAAGAGPTRGIDTRVYRLRNLGIRLQLEDHRHTIGKLSDIQFSQKEKWHLNNLRERHPNRYVRLRLIWRNNTNIMFLDIIHRPVFF